VSELRIAVIGSGGIARDHVAALDRLPGVRVTHVVGSDADRVASVARLARGAVGTTDRAAVLDDAGVDAFLVCTLTESHAAISIEALRRGKPVMVEKPVALSLADFDAMTSAAREHRASLMVGQTARFQPVNAELHRALADGVVGRLGLLKVTTYLGYVWPHGWRAWQFDLRRSGGHPVHNGVHPIDLAVWLSGRRPVRVFARSFRTFSPALPMPDSFHVTLRFDDGSLALLELGYGLHTYGSDVLRLLAVGTDATIQYSTEGEPGLTSDVARMARPAYDDAIDRQLAHWVATLRGDAEQLVRWDQVRATLAAALAAQRSLETGEPVRVEEVNGA
jgi:predicted dehydrogenase